MSGSGLRIPIRLKLLALMASVLLLSMAVYLSLAVKLISDDRLTYAFGLNERIADMLAAQARATVESLGERMRLYGSMAAGERDPARRRALARHLFRAETDLVRVVLHVRNRAGELEPDIAVVEAERLPVLEIGATDLADLDRTRPLPLASVGDEPLVIANRSLPPSAPLLSIATTETGGRGPPAWVVAADFVPDKLLAAFGSSSFYTAYLVDVDGSVVTHPRVAEVIGRSNFARVPVVEAALEGRGARSGALEFVADDGRALLGAWARVGAGRLSVIAETEREAALAAARQLVRLSALFGIAVVLAAFLITIFAARMLTTPIRRLSAATAEIARGHYGVDPKIDSRDEIGDLARSFKRMAEEIHEGQLKLLQSEKLAAFGQLGAGITHEIKNPLGAIRGFAQLGMNALDDAEQVKESLQIIERETDRCLEIVQNFLKFARQDPGRRTDIELNLLVTEGLKIVAHQLSTSGVRLHRELGDAPDVHVSPGQIQQVLLNLLLNAEQAAGRGGNAWVSTGTSADGRAEIAVRDSGPGIPADLLARVFDPFFTTKAEGKGTGLGLSVSYGIVKEHQGELVAANHPDGGAVFRVLLPPVAAGVGASG